MKAIACLVVAIGLIACDALERTELIQRGYQQKDSYFRNQEVYAKDRDTVIVHKQVQKARTIAELEQQLEENRQGRDWESISPSVYERRLKGPSIGTLPDDYFRFIPTYIGSVVPGGKPVTWSSPCYNSMTATASVSVDENGNFTGLNLWVDPEDKVSFFCDDGYLLATAESFTVHYFILDGNGSISFTGEFTDYQQYDMMNNGIRIFRFSDDITMSVVDVWETLQLFLGSLIGASVPSWTAEDNIKFLADYANWTVEYRSTNLVDFPEDQIQSGWFLGIIRLDGLDPMLAWGMGSHTGHTAITLRINGTLYVCESTINDNYWPTNGIQKTPWKKWLQQAQAANFNVVLLPLSPTYQALFNEQQAYEWFQTVEGLPYGFHNMLFGWIDTPEDNYPPPLTSELAMLLMVLLDDLIGDIVPDQAITDNMWSQAINHRLNTTGLNTQEAYYVAAKMGLSFTDLVTIPELDEWNYQNNNSTGPSMVCDVLVLRMYKAAGIFGSITNTIQGTEFTNWDVYSLNIFDGNFQRPPQCVAADPDIPYCQLMGEIRMTLPGYNTYTPFPHMREHCPTLPPSYKKPANC